MMNSFSEEVGRYPFVRLLIPFILGVILSIQIPINSLISTFFVLVSFVILSAILIFKIGRNYNLRWLYGFFISMFLFVSGIELVNLQKHKLNENNFENKGFMLAEIAKQPSEKDKIVKAILNVNAIKVNNQWIEANGEAIVFFEKDSLAKTLKTGDEIIFEPQFNAIENSGNPHEFDYKQYLSFHLISQQTYLKSDKWHLLEKAHNKGIVYYSEQTRDYLLSLFKNLNISGNEYSVLSALTLGYQDKIDEEIKKAYSTTGATHILSVSGMHVGIVYIVFSYLLSFIRRNKFTIIFKATVLILFLWSYAFISGMSPSVMRSAIMFSFVALATTLNRHTSIYNTLCASAFLLLLYNPFMVMDIGFQLSYLAVFGIVFFQPKIYKLMYVKNKILDGIWSLVSVSIAAQLTTTPISLFYFHQFPNYFLLTNILVVPLSTIIIYVAIFLLIFASVPFLNIWVGKLLAWLVFLLNHIIMEIEKLPYSLTSNIQIDANQSIILSLMIAVIALYIFSRKALYIHISMILFVGFLSISIFKTLTDQEQKRILVYNIKGTSAYNFIDGKDNILFSNYEAKMDKNKMMFHVKNNWINLGVENEKVIDLNQLNNSFIFTNLLTLDNQHIFQKRNFIKFYNKSIYLMNGSDEFYVENSTQQSIDFVIVSSNCSENLSELRKKLKIGKVIIDSSNSKAKITEWKTACFKQKIPYFSVKDMGAFEIEI